ncbi:MAG: hypothetical protein IKJ58_05265 [Akkermansia sp.]|nr:hypothetical protein [Akkermansia sp.]
MKNSLWFKLVLAACTAMTASAVDADFAQVTLRGDTPGLSGKLVQAVEGKPATMSFTESRGRSRSASWQRIGIPVQIEGRCRRSGNDAATPDYIEGLTVTVHVLFKTKSQSGGDSYARVSKTLTYHEIALSRGSGANNTSKTEMTVDLFLSPRNAMLVSSNGPNAHSTDVKVVAIAMEASLNGTACMSREESSNVVFDRADLPRRWWEASGVDSNGAVLYALNETPYAYAMPDSMPWVTTDASSTPSTPAAPAPAPSGTTSTGADSTGSADSGTTPTGGDSATPDSADESTSGRRGRNSSRNSRRTRRNR